MDTGNYITLIVFVTGLILAAIGGYYGFVRKIENRVTIIEQRCKHHVALLEGLTLLNTRIEKVSSDNETFWKILGPHLAGIIHSPTNRERDELVDKFVHNEMERQEEMERLVDLLHEAIYSGRWTGDRKLAGALLLARAKAKIEVTNLEKANQEDVWH